MGTIMTTPDVTKGMGLDEILANDHPAVVFGALQSTIPQEIALSLNPQVSGGVAELLKLLDKPDADVDTIVAAIADQIAQLGNKLTSQITADLDAQDMTRKEASTVDIVDSLFPSDVADQSKTSKTLVDLVASPTLKGIASQI